MPTSRLWSSRICSSDRRRSCPSLAFIKQTEGIIPAIESSHAIAEAVKRAPKLSKDEIIIINVSGRGDKDVAAIADYLEAKK